MSLVPPINGNAALSAARAIAKPSPALTTQEKEDCVAELHRAAIVAQQLACDAAELPDPGCHVRLLVTNRSGWAGANIESFPFMLADAAATSSRQELGYANRIKAQLYGVQFGTALGMISSRVLGQFDPFIPGGRLVIVAPNIVEAEKELALCPSDFRLWVSVHELTHRLQFHAAPWLASYLQDLILQLLAETKNQEAVFWRELSPINLAALDKVTAVMSILEGHADVMMDEVGTEVIATLPTLRTALAQRRRRNSDKILRKILGLDTKMAQYRDGAAFCRDVLSRADKTTLNQVFASAESLPTKAELSDAAAWLARIG
ncbi:MAG: zinc-dependent metalloprotease [Propionibacteriaceae bacterium]